MPRARLRELDGVGCSFSVFSRLSFSSRTRAVDGGQLEKDRTSSDAG